MEAKELKPKDFASDQDVKWCPGCGDYSILKQVQSILPQIGVARENIVFVSGIGCSSRFPYYMNTYGMHSIHGRAPAVASGLKIANPDLSIWVITGDGDSMSIGGNHLIHLARRNVNMNVLLFNNEIYGLTKGQFSPTSQLGLKTKSSPMGVIDSPFNPLSLILGANATFVARAMDRDPKNLRETLLKANEHKGTSFVEIYQNCHVFNDNAFGEFTEKETKPERAIFLENGKPLVFGKDNSKGMRLNGLDAEIVDLSSGEFSEDDLWVHDEQDKMKAQILIQFFEDETKPRPFGVIYNKERGCYEDALEQQLKSSKEQKGEGSLDDLLRGNQYWAVG